MVDNVGLRVEIDIGAGEAGGFPVMAEGKIGQVCTTFLRQDEPSWQLLNRDGRIAQPVPRQELPSTPC